MKHLAILVPLLACWFTLLSFASAAEPPEAKKPTKSPFAEAPLELVGDGDGSITLPDGSMVPPSGVRRALQPLLSKSPKLVVLRVKGDFQGMKAFTPMFTALREAKVAKLKLYLPNEPEPRMIDLTPIDLAERITAATDEAVRQDLVAELLAGMRDESKRPQAIYMLRRLRNVPFDRAPFLAIVRQTLADPSRGVDLNALLALGEIGGGVEDVPTIVRYISPDNKEGRQVLAAALFGVDPEGKHPATLATVESLLRDPATASNTMKAMLGRPSTPAIDELLIEQSREIRRGAEVVYYALTTRPILRKPVAERLIELGKADDVRAVWGLARETPDDSCREEVGRFLIQVAKTGSNEKLRREAIIGLGNQKPGGAETTLTQIASGAESPALKQEAERSLEKLRGKKKAAGSL